MPKYSLEVRAHGALAYARADGNMQQAIKAFSAEHPTPAADMPRPDLNIKRWAMQLQQHGYLHDQPRSGRPRKVPQPRLELCITAIKRARRHGGIVRHYVSMAEAMRHEQVLRDTVAQCGVTPHQLLRTMHKVDPSLARGKERLRRYLDRKHRQARSKAARSLLRLPMHYLKRVFYLDAKHLYIVPHEHFVYCDAAELGSLWVEDPHYKHSHPLCLNYYAMVNYFEGTVDLVYVSGTSKKKIPYQVSTTPFVHP